jgi:hypothetical protein
VDPQGWRGKGGGDAIASDGTARLLDLLVAQPPASSAPAGLVDRAHAAAAREAGRLADVVVASAPRAGVLVAATGVAVALALAILDGSALMSRVVAGPTSPVPGHVVVEVGSPGRMAVYYRGASRMSAPALGLAVAGPDGRSVPVQSRPEQLRYDGARAAGEVVAEFDASVPGPYVVSADAPGGVAAALTIAPSVWPSVEAVLIRADAVALAGLVAAAGIVVLARRRVRADWPRRSGRSSLSVRRAAGPA